MDPCFSSAVFLILSCWLWNAECRNYNQILKGSNEGWRGKWGALEMCQKGYANGFSLKFQPYRGTLSDDSSLTGIRIHCEDGTTVESSTSVLGDWGNLVKCSSGNLISFQLQVAVCCQVFDDASAANNIKFTCQDQKVLETSSPTGWGTYGPWSDSCKVGAICGIKTKVEPYVPDPRFDNTGLNDVMFSCCN